MGLGSGIRDPGSENRDPRSGIRKNPILDPISRGQKGTGSRIRNTAGYRTLNRMYLHFKESEKNMAEETLELLFYVQLGGP